MNPTPQSNSGLHYLTEGDGDPVVLVHGMAASNQHWPSMLHDLAQAGFRGYAPDLPGHGASPKPDEPSQYSAQAVFGAFERWMVTLGSAGPVRLVGHSLGGFMSLLYTHRHPQRVASLVLIDPYISQGQLPPVLRLINRRPGVAARAYRKIPPKLVHLIFDLDLTITDHFPGPIRETIAMDHLRASPNIIYLGASIWDLTPSLPEIQTPTLLIWGERDRTLKPASFRSMAQQLPQVEIYPIPGIGHQPQIGRAEQINRRIIEFFQGA